VSRADKLIRVSTAAVVVGVAAVAVYVSYRHAFELISTHGETGATAALLPFTVDGLIFSASMVLLDAARRGERPPALARWLLGAGVLATLGANVAHGLAHGPVGAVISGWPALVAVGSFEMLSKLIRGGRPGTAAAASGASAAEVLPEDEGALASARERFGEVLSQGDVPSVRQLRQALKVGHPRAVRIRAALDTR
jgi:hypothetical protein